MSDTEERGLKLAQLRAGVANKNADADHEKAMIRLEPCKVFAAILWATAASVVGVFGALGYTSGRSH